MLDSWITILPPLVVIITAAIAQQIHFALSAGIVAAVLVAKQGAMIPAFQLGAQSVLKTGTDIDNLLLYGFLFAVAVLVALFTQTGSAASFCNAIIHKIRSARTAQYSSMVVSALLFIDDYLSILTAGYILRPLMDEFKIARLKLAFLVHSLAGPIVILAPVSSWVATIIAYINQAGVESTLETNTRILADPFYIYLRSIPFIFYSFLMIFSVWFIIYNNISFGPMDAHKDDVVEPTSFKETDSATVWDLLLPLATLIFGIMIGLPLAGGYWLFGGSYGLIDALKYNEHPFQVMLICALLAIGVSFSIGLYRKTVNFNAIPALLYRGFDLMFAAIGMVFLASTLSGLLADQVGTGQYLASVMLGSIPFAFIPFMCFIVALICTIATGSSWGSFALLIPIAIPMLVTLSGLQTPIDPQLLPLLFPVLGAIFSGSVCGDHVSPLSETTMMTATSTGTKIFTHAYTQFFYALPAIIASGICYILVGFLVTTSMWWAVAVSGLVGIGLTSGMLLYFNK